MIVTTECKARLRSKAATAQTWQDRKKQQEEEARSKAIANKIHQGLEAFSERCHAYALTPQGQARAEELRDIEYDKQVSEYNWKQFLDSTRS